MSTASCALLSWWFGVDNCIGWVQLIGPRSLCDSESVRSSSDVSEGKLRVGLSVGQESVLVGMM
jgi:hypothetical protein